MFNCKETKDDFLSHFLDKNIIDSKVFSVKNYLMSEFYTTSSYSPLCSFESQCCLISFLKVRHFEEFLFLVFNTILNSVFLYCYTNL
jgi:hypothetical protein